MFKSFSTGVFSLRSFSLSRAASRTWAWALAPAAIWALMGGVAGGQSITVPAAAVGQNLQTSITIFISPVAPLGGLSLKVTSSDPSKLLVAGRPTDLGTQQTTFVIPENQSAVSGIYLQGLVNTGTVTITASAPGYQSGMATITLTPSGFLMTGPGGASFTTNVGAASSTLTLTPVRLDSSLRFAESQQVRGGFSTSVGITSSNPSVGTAGTPVSFVGGDGSATTPFTPAGVGSTTLTAAAPAGFSTPASGNSVAVTVNPATLQPSSVTVGKNLETTTHVTGAASGLPITVTSNNPSLVLLACLTAAPSCVGTTPNGPGAASITVMVPNGQNVSPDFYLYGLADTGTATYTAAATGFVPGTGTVTLAKSGFVIAGPAGIGQPSFVPLTSSTDINVFAAILDASGNFVATQAVAGNLPVNVNVSSSNTAVGTISTSPVTITGGSFGATTQFNKGSGGSSDLTVSTPAGFTTPTSTYTKVTAIVLSISFALSCDGGTIGQNLETDCTVAVGQPAPAGGLPVTLTSNNSGLLLLSATPTGVGSASIIVTIPAGSTSANYVAQALGGAGTVTHTASANGFANRTATSTLAPSGVIIVEPGGALGQPFFSATVSGGPVPVMVFTAVLNPANNSFLGTESLRGGAPSVQVTLSSTNTGVGTIASPVTITAGSGSAVAQFTPKSGGSTTLLVGTPAGFTASSNDKSLAASVTGSPVGPPAITKAFGAATIPLNGSTSLVFTVTNPTTTALSATAFTDSLPAGLVVATPNGLTATCTGTITATAGSGSVSLTGAGLGGSASCTVSVNVTGTTAGIKNNSVTVSDTVAGTGNTATAAITVGAPSVFVVPSSGSGSSQAFTFTYTDSAGYQDISGSQIIINSSTSGAGACYILFGRGSNAIALADDAGTPGPLTTIGAPTVLQNSQCSVLASISSQSFSGNTSVLTVFVVFKPSFAGPKNVYTAFSTNGGVSSGLQQVGTYTATVNTTPISAVSVTPASGSGQAQAFTFDYFDPNGFPNTSGSQVLFSPTTSAVGQCYILFGRGTNQIGLADDSGSNFSLAPLGGQTVLQNSQCSVLAANSYQSGQGTHLFLTLFVAFKPVFAGAKNVYSGSTDNGGNRSAFVQLGTWTVLASLPPLAVNSVTPSVATGPSNPLTFVFSDPTGFADISGAQVIVNPTQSTGAGSCYIQFARSGLIALTGDDGVSTTTANLGQPTFLQNSQCIVNAAASYQAGTGNYLSLTLFVTMKTTGAKNVYASVSSNNSATSGFSQVGTWNVTSPSVLTPVSVSPGTAAGPAGTPQFFTFTYSDPLGASDISGSQIIINPALQGAFACYVLYGRGTNLVAIANNTANTFTNGTLGTAGTLQNSQCSIDLSKSFQVQTGNTVNLTLAVNFAPSYKGLMYAFSNVVNNAGNASAFPALGAFLVQ